MQALQNNVPRRRASGLIRTFVVASATLAILLVCFAMYQYTQVEPLPDELPRPRLPSIRQGLDPAAVSGSMPEEGVAIGTGQVGPGREIKLTIYAPEGTRARFEIEVDDWTPKPGAVEEFILVHPRIRMQTRSGNAVRVTANEGLIEAQRRAGGSLDPRRGRLTGNVIIEYDRLTETERAALPPERRSKLDPRDIVRAEMDEIEFDLDYAKVIVPGRLSLTAVDAELIADDLSINFNEAENRVESLHIAHGGRLLLRPTDATIDDPMPGLSTDAQRDVSLVDWLRETIRERVTSTSTTPDGTPSRSEAVEESRPTNLLPDSAAVTATDERAASAKGADDPLVTRRPDGVYVFHNEPAKRQRDETPVPYFARFEGDVDVSRRAGDTTTSRLQADWLEIIREVTASDTRRTDNRTATTREGEAPPEPPLSDELVLAWSGRLGVKALNNESNADDSAPLRTKVTAGGAPARLAWSEGEALCRQLTYLPTEAEVRFTGDGDQPARLHSLSEGSFTGQSLTVKRTGDAFLVDAAGPGQLQRTADWVDATTSADIGTATVRERAGTVARSNAVDEGRGADEGRPANHLPADAYSTADGVHAAQQDSPLPPTQPQTIIFRDSLSATGRFIEVRRPDFTNLTMRQLNERVIDRAEFRGAVRMLQDDVTVETDALTVTFASQVTWRGGLQQSIEHVRGEGDVLFAQEDNRLTCREIDVALTTDDSGAVRPAAATARGDVVAHQGSRSIRARDKLIMDMGPRRDISDPDHDAAYDGTVDRSSIALQRLRAFGDVAVSDPRQALDVTAETLDCAFNAAAEIETAIVTGLDQRPASVRLEDFTVVGQRIDLNVPDEWAEVPGAGRLTLRSSKNLDGQRAPEPIPIIVTWTDHLHYQGRENRAVFTGGVHATSQSGTTFDCERLLVEFDDVPQDRRRPAEDGTGFWRGLFDQVTEIRPTYAQPPEGVAENQTADSATEKISAASPGDRSSTSTAAGGTQSRAAGFSLRDTSSHPGGTDSRSEAVESRAGNLPADSAAKKKRGDRSNLDSRFAKEPVYILATGRAVALTSDLDPDTGDLLTRTRISGPKLSVNLREEVSKMLIEGAGSLLLEDYRPRPDRQPPAEPRSPTASSSTIPGGLLSDSDTGPSTTLIEWKHTMWYDFSIDQTRFEGNVELKHFSGLAMQRMFNRVAAAPAPAPQAQTNQREGRQWEGGAPAEPQSEGRRTFLRCDLLTVDFLDRDARRKSGPDQRMGQISAGALRQFDARGAVQLQDETEGLTLWASQVIYERPRQILVIHGAPQQRARIIKKETNRLPTQLTVMRLNYDLATGNFQILDPGMTGQ